MQRKDIVNKVWQPWQPLNGTEEEDKALIKM